MKYHVGVPQSKISKYLDGKRLWRSFRRRPLPKIAILLTFLALCGAAYTLSITNDTSSSSPGHSRVAHSADPLPASLQHAPRGYGLALGDTLPFLTSAQLDTELNGIAALGVNWIRIDMAWPDIQPQSATEYDWASMDHIVAAASSRKIHILGVIDYTPPWARSAGCNTQKCAPANDSQFAAFAAAAAKRYAGQNLHTWEIWNEPNLEGSWQPAPNPAAYTQLLQATYKALKQVDPSAVVMTGGLGPLDDSKVSIPQLAFLQAIYNAGAEPYFDAIGYHPYSFPALPSYTIDWNSWSTLAALPTSVRSIMAAHGDSTKQVWITEYGAPTNGPGPVATLQNFNFNGSPDHVDEALQAQMATEAVAQYKTSSWLGGFFWYSYQDLGTTTDSNGNFYGLLRYDGSYKPAYYAYHAAIIQH